MRHQAVHTILGSAQIFPVPVRTLKPPITNSSTCFNIIFMNHIINHNSKSHLFTPIPLWTLTPNSCKIHTIIIKKLLAYIQSHKNSLEHTPRLPSDNINITKNLKRQPTWKLVRIAWRATPSRQAVHMEKPIKWVLEHL